jgi:Mor family transcriptional regulator
MTKRIAESRKHWIHDIALGLRDEFSLDQNESLQRACSLIDRIAAVRPADFYYWPARSKDERDAAIAREFNGANLDEITRRYGVSKTSVYSIRSKAMAKRGG